LSPAAEYIHSSQSLGRLRRLVAPLLFRAAPLIRLRAAPPLAVASHPAPACRHRSPDGYSICAPKSTFRRCCSPATPPSNLRAEARRPKTPCAPLCAEPAEACSTLAERGPPSTAWAETHSTLAKLTLIAPRDRSRASRTTSAPSHHAAETTRCLQSRPHQLARPKPTLADGARSGSHREPKPTLQLPDQCRRSPQPKSPWAVHILLDLLAQPKLHSLVLCRAASRSSARTADPVKRPAASFSVHTFVRDARRADPSSDEVLEPAVRRRFAQPGPLSEDTVPGRRRADQNKFRSTLQCELVSPQLPPARPRSCRVRGAETHRLAAANHRTPEEVRFRITFRPKPGDATCLYSAQLHAAEPRTSRSDQLTDLSANASLELPVRRPFARPKPLSEDGDSGHRRVDQNKFRSALRREPISSQPSPARPKPRGSGRRNAPDDCRDLPNSRRSPTRDHLPTEAGRCNLIFTRPFCKQYSFALTGQTSLDEHTYARSHVRAKQRRLSSVRTTQAR